jgi:hypothetical protein
MLPLGAFSLAAPERHLAPSRAFGPSAPILFVADMLHPFDGLAV